MVLLNDNFATIVSAVEEGRAIYDNIRRFVKFSIAGNLGKVLVMLVAPFLGMVVALQPLQLLWLNLLTDGLLGLGLGVEPADPKTMQRPPRSNSESFFGREMVWHVGWVGLFIGVVTLAVGYFYFNSAEAGNTLWQTMMFTTLAFMQIGQALASRSTHTSLRALGLLSNPLLLVMVVVTVVLQLIVIYVPFLDTFFQVTPLGLGDLLLCVGLGVVTLLLIEAEKMWVKRG
jgi:Ca2+-transporting ATPase